jgi:hypothetical protein
VKVNWRKFGGFVIAAWLLALPAARAQDQPNSQSNNPSEPIAPLPPDTQNSAAVSGMPIPAARGAFSSGSESRDLTQAQPDTLLSGAETFSVKPLRRLVPIFDPALQFSEFGETGLVVGQTFAVSTLGGNLDVEQQWGRYRLIAQYRGADTIYQPSYYFHYLPYHEGSMSQEIILGRWMLRLRDDVQYSSGSVFSGLFTGGPAQAGNGSLNSIQPSLVSSGTIQTGLARQLYNTSVVEVDYARSRRTNLTFVGSYGMVHFLDSGYINTENINGRVGYNYALSAKNNIAVTYDHDRVSFVAGTTSRLQSDSVQMAFGRKVAGRLAFQVAAGPQFLNVENLGLLSSRHLSWSAFSALTYQWRRTGYSLSYFRGVGSGSGVFAGSNNETVTATANREITRLWSASVNGGYAINKSLVPVAISASRFDDWFASATLNRQIGRQVRLGVSYGHQQQTSGGGGCPVLSCGLPSAFSQFGITLQWHPLVKELNSGDRK